MNNLEKFKKNIENDKITKQEGNFSLLIFGSLLRCAFPPIIDKYYDFNFVSTLFLMDKDYGGVFFDMSKYYETTENTFKKILKNEGKDSKEIINFNKFWNEINDIYSSSHPDELKDLSDKDLEKLIKKSFSYLEEIIGATVFIEALDKNISQKLFNLVSNNQDKFNKFFEVGSISSFESFSLRYDQILIKAKKENDPYKSQYLFCDYYLAPILGQSEEKINKEIKNEGGIDAIKEEINKIKEDLKKNRGIIKEYRKNLSQEESYLLDFMQKAMHIRDIRKEPVQKISTVLSNSMREYLSRNGIADEYAVYANSYDFDEGLNQDEKYKDVLGKRKEGVSLYIDSNGYTFEYNDIDEMRSDIYSLMDKNKDNKNITGNTACRGVVEGKVKVILNESDFSKFEEGDVIITSMTRPEFVPLMKKASAVVTDEGGITCHAAIVSRELGVPCVIGTNNATRLLNDGDNIKVDATEGIVKIIKKNNE